MQYRTRTLLLILTVLFIVAACSSGGSDQNMVENCGGNSIDNFVNPQVSDIVQGLTFTFSDGEIFHPDLAANALMFTFDMFDDPLLTIILATPDNMAIGEVELQGCNFFMQPACLYDVTITQSDFAIGAGPQTNEILELQDWRFTARENNCRNRIDASVLIEDTTRRTVASEQQELAIDRLCPMLCP